VQPTLSTDVTEKLLIPDVLAYREHILAMARCTQRMSRARRAEYGIARISRPDHDAGAETA
jgi:hypothetical protein